MSRLVRARVAWLLAVGSVVVGPSGCQAPDQESGESEDEGASEPPPGPPVILDPSELVVSAAQREDISIDAADLLPNTRVEIDGRSWSLTEPGGPVIRAGQTLRVPLGGALVVGQHELILTHQVGKQNERSEPLPIRVEAAVLSPLLETLEPEVVGVGDRLHDVGPGERLLAVIDDAAQTVELRLAGWAVPGVVQALPGLAEQLDVTLVELEQQRWLITTWLADGGERVLARITTFDGDDQLGEPGEPIELWSLADPEQRASLGSHEVAINHGVALLDRMVVIAVEARRDAEQATPGDHLLVTRWLGLDQQPAAIQLIRGPGGRDLDRLDRARSWLDLGASGPRLSVRLALGFPWLIELAGNGLPVLTEDPGATAGDVTGSPIWMTSAEAALGSRQVFALYFDGEHARVRAVRIDRWGPASFVEISAYDDIELPALPTARPSLAMIAGSPTVLFPFGADAPVWALRSTGETALLDILDFGCDAIAMSRPDADGDGDSQIVACIADGELRLGALAIDSN